MTKKFDTLFVTMFGVGKIKFVPGTFGSLITVILLYLLFHVFKIPPNIILIFLSIILIYAFVAVANYIKENDNKDPKEVVIDEFIGQSIPIYMYEISHNTEKSSSDAILFYIVCFFLFRFFDIVKPFPVSYFDKNYKNNFGVIMDDICAGFYVVIFLIFFMVIKSFISLWFL